MSKVIDQAVREELLTPNRSYIVQAPAGSGKTELLTQRILALLNVVDKPENILAITFTKKAAAEMRERVVSALVLGGQPEPTAAHERFRWKLAQKVLQKDKDLGWNLVANPARLNITTIDSLSSSLSAALPLLSQTGAMPNIVEDASKYYRLAVDELMKSIGDNDEVAENIKQLLRHKDNNFSLVCDLLAQMLAKRLQWFSPLQEHARMFNRETLVHSLETVTEATLKNLYSLFPTDIISEIPRVLNFASKQLKRSEKAKCLRIRDLEELGAFSSPAAKDIQIWKAIAELFLTDKGELRKTLQESMGFPAKTKGESKEEKLLFETMKKETVALISGVAHIPDLIEELKQVSLLPADIELSTSQASLKSVIELLPRAAAHLKLIFSRYNVIDFSELSLSALDALGHEDLPSDLALALDYRLEHILIDEFQDTASPQIQLIESLIAGWQIDDHKSLFFVGDPMQSIYRFRDANVSLFMKIREQGVGGLPLEFRQLQVNFRSSQTIVEWVNNQFKEIMPPHDNLTLSAVSYANSVAFNNPKAEDSVSCILYSDAQDDSAQAQKVLSIVEHHLDENLKHKENKTLAILARSRGHLRSIVDELNKAGILFEAIELDSLSDKMVVNDLVNFAFALTDVYDELSWAACMRSPWFGLKLDEIKTVLTDTDCNLSIPDRIKSVINSFKCESKERASVIVPLLEATIELKGDKPFRKWLSGSFEAVGGLSQLDFESDLEDYLACLDKLTELSEGGELNDRSAVNEAISKLYASPNPKADKQVQLMTIHKSKGLEFDTVILPNLDKAPPPGDQSLLKWTEVVDEFGHANPLLAVSRETGKETDEVYQYISYLDKRKSEYEAQRVLYVAATRAKSKLYLLGNVRSSEKEESGLKRPDKRAYLGLLWDGIVDGAEILQDAVFKVEEIERVYDSRAIKVSNIERALRIPSKIHTRETQQGLISREEPSIIAIDQPGDEIEFHASNEIAPAIGTVIHRQLEWLSSRWHPEFQLSDDWEDICRHQLRQEGISEDGLNDAKEKVMLAIKNTMSSDFGQFVLMQRESAQSELVMHKKLEQGNFLTRVIDRTFIHDDVRWIIDYKSSQPEKGEDLAIFVGREKALYQLQITDYFNMYVNLEKRAIKAGLYFPLIDHFELMLESNERVA